MSEKSCWTFDEIAGRLRIADHGEPAGQPGRTRAAVAMILSKGVNGLQLLFIQRAPHDHDPWSGHIAFPGGKLEEGEAECQAASRETLEETGIDLSVVSYLGRLSDIVGANLPVRVSCCLFGCDRQLLMPVLNDEVSDLFWVDLKELRNPERHQQSVVSFGEKSFTVPAIVLPVAEKPVLWGITYRLVMQLLDILDGDSALHKEYAALPAMVELDEEVD